MHGVVMNRCIKRGTYFKIKVAYWLPFSIIKYQSMPAKTGMMWQSSKGSKKNGFTADLTMATRIGFETDWPLMAMMMGVNLRVV